MGSKMFMENGIAVWTRVGASATANMYVSILLSSF
jgi:hypothetical protein